MISENDINNLNQELNNLKKELYNNEDLKLIKKEYNNIKFNKNIYFIVIEEHYKNIIKFENNIDELINIINIIKILYNKNDSNYILLYNNSKIILEDFFYFLENLLIQTKKIIN